MVRKVTLSGGVLDGKTFIVGEGSTLLVHHAAHGGHYALDGAAGVWSPDVVADVTVDSPKLQNVLGRFPEPTGIERAVAKAAEGYRVLLVAQRRKDAAEELRSLVHAAHQWGEVERVSRANGAEHITFVTGGFIRPIGLNSPAGARGLSADVLYLLDVAKDAPALADVLPSLNGSTVGSIITHGEGDA